MALWYQPLPTLNLISPTLKLNSLRCNYNCNLSILNSRHTHVPEPEPVFASVKTFAPATVANLGPGFDFLGCTIDGLGDFVSLFADSSVRPREIAITQISGNAVGKLNRNPLSNCAGIVAIEVMNMPEIRSVGLSLLLEKGLPLGSGLESSTTRAIAVNKVFGEKLRKEELELAGLNLEEKVSSYHADNVRLAIMGGFVLIRNYESLDLKKLNFPEKKDLYFVLVSPKFEAPTKKMRAVLPLEIGMANFVWNSSLAVALAAAVLEGNVAGLGRALSGDRIVKPRQVPLILGMEVVKKTEIEVGAFGCTISRCGKTCGSGRVNLVVGQVKLTHIFQTSFFFFFWK